MVRKSDESRRDVRLSSPVQALSGDGHDGAEALAPAVAIRKTFRHFWPVTRGVRLLFVVGVVFAIVAAACEVAAIRLFGFITDEVLASQDLGAFWKPAFLWLGLAILAGGASFCGDYITALGGERFLLALRDKVFAHLQTLTPDFFDNRRLGDLMARLTDDIEAIEELLGSGMVRLLTTLISVVFFVGAAFYIRWDLALVTLALVPAFIVASKLFASRFRTASARERRSNGAMNSVIEESLANQSLVQAYNRQEAEAARLHREGQGWLRANMTQARLSALYEPVVQVLETLCLLVIIGVGAWEIAAGRLTIGGLLAFAAYLAYLYPAVQSLGEIALTVSEAAAGSDRVIEILRARPAVQDATGEDVEDDRPRDGSAHDAAPAALTAPVAPAAPPPSSAPVRGRVEFRDVTFTYPNRAEPTLRDLSFTVEPGELLVCTGPSGTGKSTIAKLLLRFYDPDAGGVFLDGVDVRTLPLRALRDRITLLQQENLLFSGTVRDNIAYGSADPPMDAIVNAAIMADAHEFITRLPEQYDTPIGQRGRLLSGGQRQRIAIARALVRDAPVLVLDEPMTGLDAASVARIMEPLRRLMAGRTTILITHDLDLLAGLDARRLDLGTAAYRD
ncbi:ABC transporter ATP-binding protein [Thermostaphylospora chromogena]|uniref:ATP-binding cassette, subfamily B n=1 Tax=Thermostaphylospora chromogena TaxID=35622 RepID=A0A1H1E8P2_9ACTN|nr:ABC transporter ATP-binding protein [Thermostaphylospora chromogena]SDQ85132.1 ATP-binding cassette, subfamily B [Thermostaphylospora chromogena]